MRLWRSRLFKPPKREGALWLMAAFVQSVGANDSWACGKAAHYGRVRVGKTAHLMAFVYQREKRGSGLQYTHEEHILVTSLLSTTSLLKISLPLDSIMGLSLKPLTCGTLGDIQGPGHGSIHSCLLKTGKKRLKGCPLGREVALRVPIEGLPSGALGECLQINKRKAQNLKKQKKKKRKKLK